MAELDDVRKIGVFGLSAGPDQQNPLSVLDLFKVLVGNREAILRAVDARHGIWLAMALVGLAALARDYDVASLIHRPHLLAVPFAASAVLGSLFFLVIRICISFAKIPDEHLARFVPYKRWMTGYWLTAPIAWLYAIPVETFASEESSVRFNLLLLTVVSVWRLLLFSRIASVLTGLSYVVALTWIGLTSCLIAFPGLFFSQLNLVGFMGGVSLPASDRILVRFYGGASSVVFIVGCFLFLAWLFSLNHLIFSPNKRNFESPPFQKAIVSGGCWKFTLLILALLVVGSFYFQPKLFRVEMLARQFRKDPDVDKVLDYLMRHSPASFPVRFEFTIDDNPMSSRQENLEKLVQGLDRRQAPEWMFKVTCYGAAADFRARLTNLSGFTAPWLNYRAERSMPPFQSCWQDGDLPEIRSILNCLEILERYSLPGRLGDFELPEMIGYVKQTLALHRNEDSLPVPN